MRHGRACPAGGRALGRGGSPVDIKGETKCVDTRFRGNIRRCQDDTPCEEPKRMITAMNDMST